MNKISLQLIAVVFAAFTAFAIGVASLIGVQSYQDMKEIAYGRVLGAAELFSSEYESNIKEVYDSISSLENHYLVKESLKALHEHGPTIADLKLTENQRSIYLQHQLQLARTLVHYLPVYNLKSISIYHYSISNQSNAKAQPLSFVLDHQHLWLYEYREPYAQSSQALKRNIYQVAIRDLEIEQQKIVDGLNWNTLLKQIKAKPSSAEPHDYLNQLKTSKSLKAGSAINLQKGVFNTAIWAPMAFKIKQQSQSFQEQYGASILAIQEPDGDWLAEVSSRIGAELAISTEDKIWVSNKSDFFSHFDSNNNSTKDLPFIFAESQLTIPSDNDDDFKIIALRSIEDLSLKISNLITRLTLITLATIAITGFILFVSIRRLLNEPLSKLLGGIIEVQKGNWQHRVDVHSQNELETIADSFNTMTSELEEKSHALVLANDNLEEKVRDRTEQLANAQNQLILSEKMASLGQLVAGVAHEINTPLGTSITALSFMEEALNTTKGKFDSQSLTMTDFSKFVADCQESMMLMETNLRKAGKLVSTFKNVAVNQSVEEIEQFSLLKEVDEVLLTLRPKLKQSQVKIHLDVDEGIIITSFPGAYYHILSNLITNCLAHAFPDKTGDIHITAKQVDDRAQIEFKDNGVGMDDTTAAKIFDPFYTTKRGEGGTGLGLYMIYNIITHRLVGKIKVKSKLGEGTLFTILLPLVNDDGQHDNGKDFSL